MFMPIFIFDKVPEADFTGLDILNKDGSLDLKKFILYHNRTYSSQNER